MLLQRMLLAWWPQRAPSWLLVALLAALAQAAAVLLVALLEALAQAAAVLLAALLEALAQAAAVLLVALLVALAQAAVASAAAVAVAVAAGRSAPLAWKSEASTAIPAGATSTPTPHLTCTTATFADAWSSLRTSDGRQRLMVQESPKQVL
jgi:hypothetical protein